MKKLLSLVLALVLVLSALPVFAAGETSGELLKANQFISGDENGNLKEDQLLKRSELAKLIAELNGEEPQAKAYTAAPKYDDVDKILAWAKPYVAYAQEKGWLIGSVVNGKSVFDADGTVTAQQLATVLVRALGYTDNWATNVATLADLGVQVEGGNAVSRGQAFDAIWKVVSEVKANGSDVVLGVQLGKLQPAAPVASEVTVSSVDSSSLKVLVVNFTGKVDKASAETQSNVVVKDGDNTLARTLTLSEDGTKLFVELTTKVAQSKSLKVTVDKVKAGEQTVAKFEQTVLVQDTVVPTVESAVALNAKQFVVTYSEPVELANPNVVTFQSTLKLDGKSVTAKAEQDITKNQVTYTLNNSLTLGDHSLEVKGVKDYAGLEAPAKTFTITVVEDKTAPVAVSAEVVNNTKVRVTFDESLQSVATFKVNGTDVSAAATFKTGSANKVVDLTVAKLGIAAVVEVKVEYKGQKDILGNEVKDFVTITTKVADDTTLPTVEVTKVDGNKVTLTFSKSMNATLGKVQLLDSKSKKLVEINASTGTWTADKDNKELVLTFAQLATKDAADYSLVLDEFKDASIRENSLPKTTLAFKGVDTKAPELQAQYNEKEVNAGTDTHGQEYTLYFTEEMNREDLSNLSNYHYTPTVGNTVVLSTVSKATVKVADDNKSVVIYVKEADKVQVGGTGFQVFAVRDLAGNSIATSATNVAGTPVAGNVNTTEANVTSSKVLKVKFDAAMDYVDPSLVNVAGKYPVSVTLNDDKTVATFTFESSIGTAAADWAGLVYTTGFENLATSVAGKKLATGTSLPSVTDKAAPELSMNSDDKKVTVSASSLVLTLKFGEDLSNTDLANYKNNLTVKVGDKNIVIDTVAAGANAKEVAITINGAADGLDKLEVGEQTVVVTQVRPGAQAVDGTNNQVANFSVELTVTKQ